MKYANCVLDIGSNVCSGAALVRLHQFAGAPNRLKAGWLIPRKFVEQNLILSVLTNI